MSTRVQIQRTKTDDPNVRIYFSHIELTAVNCQLRRGDPTDPDADEVCPAAETLIKIPGVAMVFVTPYSVMVFKPPTFEWDEIESPLLAFLSSWNMLGAAFAEDPGPGLDQEGLCP